MAKKINWEYSEPELDLETGEETGNTLTHTISLCYSYVYGNGSLYNIISHKAPFLFIFSLRFPYILREAFRNIF